MDIKAANAEKAALDTYDFTVIGSGVVGSALAYGLGKNGRKVLLLERDISEPDRIVGELLQPGGRRALNQLGLMHVLDNIDAATSRGYSVHWSGENQLVPYPNDETGAVENPGDQWTGCGFHHGRLIQNLRRAASTQENVTLVEATVIDLIEDPDTQRVLGVRAKPKDSKELLDFRSKLTVAADGVFSSKFRKGLSPEGTEPEIASYFVGILLDETRLPTPEHAAIFLRQLETDPIDDKVPDDETTDRPVGPSVMYQISSTETRALVDFRTSKLPPLSSGVVQRTLEKYPPRGMNPELQAAWNKALKDSLDPEKPDKRLRAMPNYIWPAYPQGRQKDGAFLVGDALNTRHPLTGGGMTVGFNDAVLLSDIFSANKPNKLDLNDWDKVSAQLELWHWRRKSIATTINTLASALYQLFSAPNPSLESLKVGCFNYFKLGGARKEAPASLASGVRSHPTLLIYHFFSVVLYSMYLMFLQGSKPGAPFIHLADVPKTVLQAMQALYTGCIVLLPVLWQEIKL